MGIGKPWTDAKRNKLRKLWLEKVPPAAIAERLHRTEHAVRNIAWSMGLRMSDHRTLHSRRDNPGNAQALGIGTPEEREAILKLPPLKSELLNAGGEVNHRYLTAAEWRRMRRAAVSKVHI